MGGYKVSQDNKSASKMGKAVTVHLPFYRNKTSKKAAMFYSVYNVQFSNIHSDKVCQKKITQDQRTGQGYDHFTLQSK